MSHRSLIAKYINFFILINHIKLFQVISPYWTTFQTFLPVACFALVIQSSITNILTRRSCPNSNHCWDSFIGAESPNNINQILYLNKSHSFLLNGLSLFKYRADCTFFISTVSSFNMVVHGHWLQFSVLCICIIFQALQFKLSRLSRSYWTRWIKFWSIHLIWWVLMHRKNVQTVIFQWLQM